MTMTVFMSESNWIAISNETLKLSHQRDSSHVKDIVKKENLQELLDNVNFGEEGHVYEFDTCPPISTYIYALAVGPYCCITNQTGFKVPMKIYCR